VQRFREFRGRRQCYHRTKGSTPRTCHAASSNNPAGNCRWLSFYDVPAH